MTFSSDNYRETSLEPIEIHGRLAVWDDELQGYVEDAQSGEGYQPRGASSDNKHEKLPMRWSTKFIIAMGCCAITLPVAAHAGTEWAIVGIGNFRPGPDVHMNPIDYLKDVGSSVGDIVTGGRK